MMAEPSMAKKKVLRVFSCNSCGHKMRFGSRLCGYRLSPAPMYNRKGTLIALLCLVLVLVFVTTAVMTHPG